VKVWRSPELREALIEKGRTRAAEFTWERTAGGTLRVIEECLSGRP